MQRFIQFACISLLSFAVLLASPDVAHSQTVAVVYVDGTNGDLDPPNFGQNEWEGAAYLHLKNAIEAAEDLFEQPSAPPDLEVEIWVAEGTYTPSASDEAFGLLNNVGIFGGFDGTETSRNQRGSS